MQNYKEITKRFKQGTATSEFVNSVLRRIVRLEKFARNKSHKVKLTSKGQIIVDTERTIYTLNEVMILAPEEAQKQLSEKLKTVVSEWMADVALAYTEELTQNIQIYAETDEI